MDKEWKSIGKNKEFIDNLTSLKLATDNMIKELNSKKEELLKEKEKYDGQMGE